MANLVPRRCGYCDGHGEVDEGQLIPDFRPCPVCGGSREVRVPSTYGECQLCDGTGKQDEGEFTSHLVRCSLCRGTGWAPRTPVYV